MSNVSVSRVRLPKAKSTRFGDKLSRSMLLKVFAKMQVGSLTIREGDQVLSLGSQHNPNQPHAELLVNNIRAYGNILTGGTVAAGESYMQGDWSSPDLPEVIRLFCANMQVMQSMEKQQAWYLRWSLKLLHTMNRNTRDGSRKNIAAHYDLGNEFFQLFLDPTMMYSSALFDQGNNDLETASIAKLDEICRQLELTSEDHLLEIGTGWGGMAIHAAREYGCRVTTTTISREQFEYAKNRVRQEGLEDSIVVLCEDYRKLEGSFDKLVSIEMIEAVGHEFYRDYFSRCSNLLKPQGKMVIQAITMSDQRYQQARDSVDFIKRYIFPGGCLPSVAVITDHLATDTDMQLVHLKDITEDYAITLAQWRERFTAQLHQVRQMGFDQQFIHMWDFYLAYCEGGFRERIISTVQLSFAKPEYRFSRA